VARVPRRRRVSRLAVDRGRGVGASVFNSGVLLYVEGWREGFLVSVTFVALYRIHEKSGPPAFAECFEVFRARVARGQDAQTARTQPEHSPNTTRTHPRVFSPGTW
jgi:hypothetical protein